MPCFRRPGHISLSRASQLNEIVADVVAETLKLFGGSGGGNAVDNKRF